ncbi:hypothetical protein EON64_17975 [archaeon]|nr:MAG: hypothetical protein EON64_17975 [archaeon]
MQVQLEKEIEVLQKQTLAQQVAEVRDVRPMEATQRVLQEREERAKKLREELEEKRKVKEEQVSVHTDDRHHIPFIMHHTPYTIPNRIGWKKKFKPTRFGSCAP